VIEIEVAAKIEAGVVVGILEEGVKVKILERAFFTKVKAEIESRWLRTVSLCRAGIA
jgi:hypothetical protein